MKYIFVLFFSVAGLINLYGQQKKLVATYHSVMDPDRDELANALKDSGLPLEQIRFANTISNAYITVGKLWIEGNKSAFRYVDRFLPEEYEEHYRPAPRSEWEQLSFFIKDLSQKKLYVVGKKLGKNKAVVDELAIHNDWQLISKDSTINELPCRLAVNKKYGCRAWYSTKIPIPQGPEIFGGLPGLIVILEIPEQKKTLVLQNIKEEPFDSDVLVVGEAKKKLTYEEYKQQGY